MLSRSVLSKFTSSRLDCISLIEGTLSDTKELISACSAESSSEKRAEDPSS
jgi:hypothetical protein